jgi:hypothetical protein
MTYDSLPHQLDHLFGTGARADDYLDAWIFAAEEATAALHAWLGSGPDRRGAAHTVYAAALDREERAAELLAVACRDGQDL